MAPAPDDSRREAAPEPVLGLGSSGITQVLKPVLLSMIRGVRTRWRWKVVLRSLTVLLGAGVGTILVAAYGSSSSASARRPSSPRAS